MIHVSAPIAVMATNIRSMVVNGLSLPPLASVDISSAEPEMAATAFLSGGKPTSQIFLRKIELQHTKNMNMPARPKPHEKPTFSPMYPQSMMPRNA